MNSLSLILALTLTIIIEGIVMLILTRSLEWVKFNLYVNLVTNPVLNISFWLIFYFFGVAYRLPVYIVGEILVIVVESLFYILMSHENLKICLLRAAATNAVSVLLGALILR